MYTHSLLNKAIYTHIYRHTHTYMCFCVRVRTYVCLCVCGARKGGCLKMLGQAQCMLHMFLAS